MAEKKKFWIQKAREKMERKGTVGALRRQTGTKEGKNIPTGKLRALVKKGGLIGKRALFALNVRKGK